MADSTIRVGMVGYGVIGESHLDIWTKVDGGKVTAVCDVKPEKAEAAAAKVGAKAYTDYSDMLKHADIDAVDICTPSGLHAQQGIEAAELGLHVLTEKPIDIDIAKVDRLIDTARRKDVRLGCIFQYRVGPQALKVKELVDAGKLGKIYSCSTYTKWWRAQSYYDSGEWRGTWALDGGVLCNQAVHCIDQLCYMCGPVAEVEYAYINTVARKMEAEDFAIAVLRYENGARGVIEASTCSYPGMTTRTEIFGEKGSAVFDGPNVKAFDLQDEKIDIEAESIKSGGISNAAAIGLKGHHLQLQDFVYAIREKRDPIVSGPDARMAVDVLTKIYRKVGAPKLGT